MDIIFPTILVLALTVILMWIGYVQILNNLVDKEEKLKYEVLPKTEGKLHDLQKKIDFIRLIQKGLIVQCIFFFGAVAFSLVWLWHYLFTHLKSIQVDGGNFETVLLILILFAFTTSQLIHFVVFYCSYKSRWPKVDEFLKFLNLCRRL